MRDLHAWETGSRARAGIGRWITFYNHQRPHPTQGRQPPAVVYLTATRTDQQVQAVVKSAGNLWGGAQPRASRAAPPRRGCAPPASVPPKNASRTPPVSSPRWASSGSSTTAIGAARRGSSRSRASPTGSANLLGSMHRRSDDHLARADPGRPFFLALRTGMTHCPYFPGPAAGLYLRLSPDDRPVPRPCARYHRPVVAAGR